MGSINISSFCREVTVLRRQWQFSLVGEWGNPHPQSQPHPVKLSEANSEYAIEKNSYWGKILICILDISFSFRTWYTYQKLNIPHHPR